MARHSNDEAYNEYRNTALRRDPTKQLMTMAEFQVAVQEDIDRTNARGGKQSSKMKIARKIANQTTEDKRPKVRKPKTTTRRPATNRKKHGYDLFNEAYDKERAKAKARADKKGVEWKASEDKMSRAFFNAHYGELSDKEIRKLARDEVYEYSEAQARTWQTAYKKLEGNTTTLIDLRMFGLTEEQKQRIADEGKRLAEAGMNGYEVAITLGQEYFGSL